MPPTIASPGASVSRAPPTTPAATLTTRDAIGIIVGIVIGAGVFTLPAFVARSAGGEALVLGLWLAGGLLSVVGALCYAELATTYPNAGGDYFFVQRAYGPNVAFIYAWARVAVITTGSITFLGFTFGDYMSRLLPLGAASSGLYAALSIAAFTLVNLFGIREAKNAQNLLTSLEVLGVLAVIVAGFWFVPAAAPALGEPSSAPAGTNAIGLAMVFVLFAYGGWSEAAYISAEIKAPRGILSALLTALTVITALYLLFNLACIRGLSLPVMANSTTLAADLLERAWGTPGVVLVSAIVAVSTLSSINATVIVGARSNFALGRDAPGFGWLGRWDRAKGTPTTGLILQGVVSLALVALGSATRQGLQTMIDFTAPVFWFFFLLIGVSVFILRIREPARKRPFRVPLYPITPLVFCVTSAYLLYASLTYVKTGAIVGVGVIVFGLGPLAWGRRRKRLALLCALLGLAVIALGFPELRSLLWG